jgi:hypothetical protein
MAGIVALEAAAVPHIIRREKWWIHGIVFSLYCIRATKKRLKLRSADDEIRAEAVGGTVSSSWAVRSQTCK